MTKKKSEKKKAEQDVPSLPLTPMIDCTFLLLIFFMLACRFRSEEGKLQAHLPTTHGPDVTPTNEPFIIDKVRLKLLWYSPDGRPRYTQPDGRLVVKIGRGSDARVYAWARDAKGNMQPDWNAVRAYIEGKKAAFVPPAEKPDMTMPVIIDARKYVPFYWVVRALDTCMAAGVANVEFAAPEIPY